MSSSSSSPTSNPIVRLYSIPTKSHHPNNNNNNLRIVHFIRHAEGTHNVEKDYKNPIHLDAALTPKGIEQCQSLSKEIQSISATATAEGGSMHLDVDCIITSPMRRCIQTAHYSFEHLLMDNSNEEDTTSESNNNDIPFVACEDWRETVNYLCDQRQTKSQIKEQFPHVNFDAIQHDHDPIWEYYEEKFGKHDHFTKVRESNDAIMLEQRAKRAWDFVATRPEKNIAVVSHSAFFMHMFTKLGVISYEDEVLEEIMQEGFENCEMRSFAFEIL